MAEKMNNTSFVKSPIVQALMLATTGSFAWLYIHSIIQYLIFHGGGASGDRDLGLLTFLPGWGLALVVALLVSWPISKRVIGRPSLLGFIAVAILSMPLSIFIGLAGHIMYHGYASEYGGIGHLFTRFFYVIGLFGLLPEGRSGAAALSSLCFLLMFVLGFVGHLLTAYSAKRLEVTRKFVLLICCLAFSAMDAYAYDGVTHGQLLTNEAVILLNNQSPVRHYELVEKASYISQGAVDEDNDLYGTVPRTHFYNPITGTGLFGFANARERLLGQDSFGINFALESVALYKQGNKDDAYRYLGHVLHLAPQDMYSVPHVFLDQHYTGYADSYEDWVQKHYSQIANDPRHLGSSLPTYVWPPTAVQTNSALYTYNQAKVSGTLSKNFSAPATGNLAVMFPSLAYLGEECALYDTETGMCVAYEGVWNISNYGQCRESSGLSGTPDADEYWWSIGGGFFYFELPGKLVPAVYNGNANTSTLAELWALGDGNRFLANAQADSAGVIKAFAKAVDPVVPTVELRKNDAQGEIIPTDGSGFGGENIYIKIKDPAGNDPGGNPTYPNPSGIYKIEIKNINSGIISEPTPQIPAGGENPVERILGNLEDGPYELTAYDGLGNKASVDFTVNRRPLAQRVEIKDSSDNMLYGRSWVKGDGSYSLELGTNNSLQIGETYAITLTFNEPVATPIIAIEGMVAAGAITLASTDQKIFTGNFTIPDQLSYSGQHVLEISAKDSTGNDVPELASGINSLGFDLLELSAQGGTDKSRLLTVGADQEKPVLGWYDGGYAWSPQSSDNTLETAPWFISRSTQHFVMSDAGNNLARFELYGGDPLAEMVTIDFPENSASADLAPAIPTDGVGYLARVTDTRGNSSHFYFNLDRNPPEVDFTSVVMSWDGVAGFSVSGAGKISDSASGIGVEVSRFLNPVPGPFPVDYIGAPLPPGSAEAMFTFNDLFGLRAPAMNEYFFIGADKSNQQGRNELWISDVEGSFSLGINSEVNMRGSSVTLVGASGIIIKSVTPFPAPPQPMSGCYFEDTPTGMRLIVRAEESPEDVMRKYWKNIPLRLSYAPANDTTILAYDGTNTTENFHNMVFPQFTALYAYSTGNTNSGVVACVQDGERIEYPYGPGSYFYSGSVGIDSKFTDVINPEVTETSWVAPGLNVTVDMQEIAAEVSNITKAGSITLSKAAFDPRVKGYRLANSRSVYDVSITAEYSGPVRIKFKIDKSAFTQKQIDGMRVYHSDNGQWIDVTESFSDDGITSLTQHVSPFAVLVPVEDDLPPITTPEFPGGSEADGVVSVSSAALISLTAIDTATKLEETAGVDKTYYLVDNTPDQACLLTQYDEYAPAGTCANPIYKGAFRLNEGAHSLCYLSVDKVGNAEPVSCKQLLVDGTVPLTRLFIGSQEVASGAVIPYGAAISFEAEDTVSNDVASGLQEKLFLIDVATSSCGGDSSFTGPAGTCDNPRYAAPFTLSVGTHTVYYTAFDKAGNQTPIKSVDVVVLGEVYGSYNGTTEVSVNSPMANVSVTYMDDAVVSAALSDAVGLRKISNVYNVMPDNMVYPQPSNITFTYDPASLPGGISEDELAVYEHVDNNWVKLQTLSQDAQIHKITARVNEVHSLFAVFGQDAQAVSAMEAPTAVYFDEVSSYSIVAAAYAPVFTGLSGPIAGTNIAKNGEYAGWHVNGDVWTTMAPIPYGGYGMGVASVGGKIYVFGGNYPNNNIISQTREFDPVSNTWVQRSPMPKACYGVGAAALAGRIYALGGRMAYLDDGKSPFLNQNVEYDPEADVWSYKAPLPTESWLVSAAAMNGKVYAVGGGWGYVDSSYPVPTQNFEYDPNIDRWAARAPMPTGREAFALAAVNGKLYAMGGYDASTHLNVDVNEEYDPVANSWRARAPLSEARQALAAVGLGGKIYVYGGSPQTSAAKAYDPAMDSWAALADRPFGYRVMTFGAVANGKVYSLSETYNDEYDPAVGGAFFGLLPNTRYGFKAKARDASGVETAETSEVYKYTLAAAPALPQQPVVGVSSYSIRGEWLPNGNPQGTLYRAQISTSAAFENIVFSSYTFNTYAEFYGLLSSAPYSMRVEAANNDGEWTPFVQLGSTKTLVQVEDPVSVYFDEISSTTIVASAYAPGGFTGLDLGQGGVAVAVNGEYSDWRSGNRWASKASLSSGRSDLVAVALGGKLYALGGYNAGYLTTNEEYDPVADAWVQRAPMPTLRTFFSAAATNDRLYVMGGFIPGQAGVIGLNEEYDPVQNSWSTKASMPTPRSDAMAGTVSGRIYVVGGADGVAHTGRNEEYDPRLDMWTARNSMPTPRAQGRGVVQGNKLYTLGGYGVGGYLGVNESYDPATDDWTALRPMPTPRATFAAASLGGKIYAIGGSGASYFAANEEYDPQVDKWTSRADMPLARGYLSGAALYGRVYAVGGTDPNVGRSARNDQFDPGSSVVFTGLQPNTRYSFKAKSRNLNGFESPETSDFFAYTLAAQPSAAAPLFGSMSADGFVVNWLPNGNPDGTIYHVRISTMPDFQPVSASLTTTELNAEFRGLALGKTYYAGVAAENSAGSRTAYSTLGSVLLAPVPTINVISPTGGYVNRTVPVSISGSGFVNGISVKLTKDGETDITADDVVVNSQGQVSCSFTLSGAAVGNWNVVVTNPYGAPVTLPEGFSVIASQMAQPTGLYFDEIRSNAIVVSPYTQFGFFGLDGEIAGVAVSKDGQYSDWRNGNRWVGKSGMSAVRQHLAAAAVGGKIYAIGGWRSPSRLAQNEEYDPVTDSWSQKAPMPTARMGLSAITVAGRIYAIGGEDGANYDKNEEYDPVADAWTERAPMPTGRYWLGAAAIGGKIYTVGGWSENAYTHYNRNEEYDPATDTWAQKADMPTPRRLLAAAALNGKLYAVGGANGTNDRYLLSLNEKYDPVLDRWTTESAMTTPRKGFAMGVAGGKIYAVGGTTGASFTFRNEEYDPVSNGWSEKAEMPSPWAYLSAAAVDGKLYAIGGSISGLTNANAEFDPGVAVKFQSLTPNTLYTFKGKARDENGVETWETQAVSTYTLAEVSGPLSFSDISGNGVTVSWIPGSQEYGLNAPGARYLLEASVFKDFHVIAASAETANASAVLELQPNKYYFRVKAANTANVWNYSAVYGSAVVVGEVPTAGILIPQNGSVVTSRRDISGTAYDNISVSAVTLKIERLSDGYFWNGSDWGQGETWLNAALNGSDWTYAAPAWVYGLSYKITAKASDNSGNTSPEAVSAIDCIDNIPPETTASVMGSLVGYGAEASFARADAVTLAAADAGSGPKETYYLVDMDPGNCTFPPSMTGDPGTCDNPLYTGPFTLPVGQHTVYYFSYDVSGNKEDVRTFNANVVSVRLSCGDTITENAMLLQNMDCSGISGAVFTIGADNVVLDGQGYAVTAPNAQVGILSSGKNNVTISNLDVSGDGAGVGLEIESADGVTLDSVRANGRLYGAKLLGASNVSVVNSDFSSDDTGLYFRGNGISINSNAFNGDRVGINADIVRNFGLTQDNDFSESNMAVNLSSAADTTLSDLYFNNPNPLAILENTGSLSFNNLFLEGQSEGVGVYVNGGHGVTMAGIRVAGYSYGMDISGGDGLVFSNIDLGANNEERSGIGVRLNGTHDSELTGVSVYGRETGIEIGGDSSNITLLNNSVSENNAGIYATDGTTGVHIQNSIVWGNEADLQGNTSAMDAVYSDIGGQLPAGSNNFSVDPLFNDSGSGDLSLRDGSLCIDAGSNDAGELPETDLGGNPRVRDGNSDGQAVVDIGAYENQNEQNRLVTAELPGIGVPELVVTSYTDMQLDTPDSGAGALALADATGSGLGILSSIYQIGPDGQYDPPVTLVFSYSPAVLSQNNVLPADIAVYEHFSDGTWQKVPSQWVDTANNRIVASVDNIASMFAIFKLGGSTPPTVETGTFVPTGSIGVGRYAYTATTLGNGKVLIAGGQSGAQGDVARADLYDPATGSFSETGSMSEGREGHVAVKLADGKVLIAGGANESGYVSSANVYDPATGIFTIVASMSMGRYGPAAVLLPDGRVLITGGRTNGNADAVSAELYDPETGTFTTTGSMSEGRTSPGAVLLSDGKVLVMGGSAGSSILLSAEIYDPATGTFSITGAMAERRYWVTPTLLDNGKVLVVGGTTAGAELYDPAAGAFSWTGSMSTARLQGAVVKLDSGNVLVAGGGGSSTAEIYDVARGMFGDAINMTTARDNICGAKLADGRVLIASGYGGGYKTSAELFVPGGVSVPMPVVETLSPASGEVGTQVTVTGSNFGEQVVGVSAVTIGSVFSEIVSWSDTEIVIKVPSGLTAGEKSLVVAKAITGGILQSVAKPFTVTVPPPVLETGTFVPTGSIGVGRYAYTATTLGNGKVLIAGGQSGAPLNDVVLADLYDPVSGTFSATGSMNEAREGHTATLLPNGKVLIVGGAADGTYVSSAELYDPATGTFSATGSMSNGRYGPVTVQLPNGKVLIAGGRAEGNVEVTSAELYDPETGTFSATGNLGVPRSSAGGVLLSNGKVLVMGGAIGGTFLTSAEIYDPATGTFSPTGSMAEARYWVKPVLLDNGKVLVVGGTTGGAELYDPASGTFSATGSMSSARLTGTAVKLNSGNVLVAGGSNGSDLATAEIYNVGSGVFGAVPDMSTTRGGITGAKLADGRVMIVGGYGNGYKTSAELFVPAGWTPGTPAVPTAEVVPSSGPIGMPFVISGSGFGAYSADTTKVLIGGVAAPLTLWNDTQIKGTVPGALAAGPHAVTVVRGTSTLADAGTFQVLAAQASEVLPSSGAIGMPFTINGAGFGNYVANYTRVLIGGATCPLTLWTDTQIKGTVPGALAAGDYELVVERALNGGTAATQPLAFKVLAPELYAIIPTSGSIGVGFTLTGANFGNYVANYTRVLIGGATAPLTLWADSQIKGTVPGSLVSGTYDVTVERELNGGLARSSAVQFTLVAPVVASVAPSSGAIGVPFTINGSSFGNYVAGYTKVLIGGTTAPLTLWSDTQIKGTVPGSLAAGDYELLVERELNGGTITTQPAAFKVLAPEIAAISPSSGAIGVPFTINGANFGNYVANYTRVLIGGTTAPLTLWTDTQIKGTVPGGIEAGEREVYVERALNGGLVRTSSAVFNVLGITASAITPSSGPIGVPFTITGSGFGNYVANYTRVLIGGATAPLTLWTDTQIKGTVPGVLAPGEQEVYVERALNGGVTRSAALSFLTAQPYLAQVTPSTAAVLAPFTITGYNFGNYVANYTKVLIGGTTTALTLWTDTKIQGKLPFLPAGEYPVLVQRYLNGGLGESATAYISVVEPALSSMTPVSGAVGTVFNIYGTGFGPYDASIAKVFMGGAQCSLSLWTDTQIRGTVPSALSYGTHTVTAVRGGAASNGLSFVIPNYTPSMFRIGTAQEFRLGDVYVYPDPAKAGKAPVFHIEVGTADTVKLRVYTVAGQLAHERTLSGEPQSIGGGYAYEYAWDGRIASGVYYYTVEAERSGKKLKARGKFAVVR